LKALSYEHIVQLADPGTGLKRPDRTLYSCRKILVLGSGHSIAHSPPPVRTPFWILQKKNIRCEFERNKTSRIKGVERRCKK